MSYLEKLENIYKAAGAVDFKIGGALTAQQTEAWFTNVRDKSEFLKRVSMRLRSKLSGNTGFISVGDNLFGRTAEGTEIGASNPETKKFSQYMLLPLDLRVPIGYSVIDDNPEHGLLEKINAVLDQGVANSLQNLAINGTLDDFSAGFLTLNKGWMTLAKASATTKKVLLTVAGNPTEAATGLKFINHDKTVRRMLQELPQEHRDRAVVLMSDDDRLARIDEVLAATDGAARVIAEAALSAEQKYQCGGKPVLTPHNWPDNFMMMTTPENLEIDVHSTVRRDIINRPERKSVDYVYSMYADMEIIHHDETVISYVTG